MLSEQQLQQIQARGVAVETFETQLENFKKGFPYLTIEAAATPAKGIKVLSEDEQAKYISVAENYGGNVCKFVPASGAATRMFKDLFEAADKLAAGEKLAEGSPAAKFVENISLFPFFDAQNILKLTLYPKAWNYGSMPKGLIQFHKYENENRTPFEEHLVEGALYAKDANGDVRMVVTVSVEHQQGFEELYAQVKEKYEKRFGCKYHVTFTNQQPSTDIVAVDMDNNPFTKDDGSLLFRPGGHGALLANLNDIDADVLVIKNIDNVVKESLLDETIRWKKILVGKATELQAKVFAYLRKMDELQDNLTCELVDLLLASLVCLRLLYLLFPLSYTLWHSLSTLNPSTQLSLAYTVHTYTYYTYANILHILYYTSQVKGLLQLNSNKPNNPIKK